MKGMKITDIPSDIQIALIKAASDMAVAKITQKKAQFDGYSQPYFWFEKSLDEVLNAYEKQAKLSK